MSKTIMKKKEKEIRDLEEIALNARKEKAEKMLYAGKVSRIVPETEIYIVESETKKDTKYLVKCTNINSFVCDCPDFSRQIMINKSHKCKHILTIILCEEYSLIKKVMKDDNEYSF